MTAYLSRIVSAAALMLLFAAIAVGTQSNKTNGDPDGKAEYAYVLTIERLTKMEEVRKAVSEWAENNKNTSEELERDKSFAEGTLAERTRFLNVRYPEISAIISQHGMSPMEYLLANRVLVHAILLLDARKQGETKDYARNVNPANLTFVEVHWEQIGKSIRFKM